MPPKKGSGRKPPGEKQNEEEPRSGAWTPSEHRAFLAAWEEHGNDWSKIAQILGTRTRVQVRTHAQKYTRRRSELSKYGVEGPVSMDGSRVLTQKFIREHATSKPAGTEHMPSQDDAGLHQQQQHAHQEQQQHEDEGIVEPKRRRGEGAGKRQKRVCERVQQCLHDVASRGEGESQQQPRHDSRHGLEQQQQQHTDDRSGDAKPSSRKQLAQRQRRKRSPAPDHAQQETPGAYAGSDEQQPRQRKRGRLQGMSHTPDHSALPSSGSSPTESEGNTPEAVLKLCHMRHAGDVHVDTNRSAVSDDNGSSHMKHAYITRSGRVARLSRKDVQEPPSDDDEGDNVEEDGAPHTRSRSERRLGREGEHVHDEPVIGGGMWQTSIEGGSGALSDTAVSHGSFLQDKAQAPIQQSSGAGHTATRANISFDATAQCEGSPEPEVADTNVRRAEHLQEKPQQLLVTPRSHGPLQLQQEPDTEFHQSDDWWLDSLSTSSMCLASPTKDSRVDTLTGGTFRSKLYMPCDDTSYMTPVGLAPVEPEHIAVAEEELGSNAEDVEVANVMLSLMATPTDATPMPFHDTTTSSAGLAMPYVDVMLAADHQGGIDSGRYGAGGVPLWLPSRGAHEPIRYEMQTQPQQQQSVDELYMC